MGNTNTVPISYNNGLENPENAHSIQEEEDSNFTCEICIEPTLSNNKFKNQNKCVHPFCTDCVAKYIKMKVEYHASAEIHCPGLNCSELLDPLSCKTLISRILFDKWCDNLCTSALVGVDKCYCPNQKCSTLVLNECGGVIKGPSKCPNCNQLFCFNCKVRWHAGYRCAESGAARDVNDVLFGMLSERQKWARCPGCGHCVERTIGCPIVTCRCRTKFCYICGGQRIRGHFCSVCQPRTRRSSCRGMCEVMIISFLCTLLLVIITALSTRYMLGYH